MLNYLFLCAYGQNRSPTAALMAQEIATGKHLDITMTYGCIKPSLDKLEICPTGPLKEKLRRHLEGFAKIFVMEEYMAEGIRKVGVDMEKVHCLNIPDEYERNEPVLKSKLREKLEDLI